MDKAKDGYVRREMYDDMYGAPYDIESVDEWPPKDQSESASNHRRRIERNKRDENTR